MNAIKNTSCSGAAADANYGVSAADANYGGSATDVNCSGAAADANPAKAADAAVRRLTAPFSRDVIRSLHAGDTVLISGTVYTARDAAHKRLCEALAAGQPLPFDIRDAVIYYVGPTPPRPGQVLGAAGPTTSGRMDAYAPTLMDAGLAAMIGKGDRSEAVITSMQKNTAVYFAATGGAGALLSKCIIASETVCYEDLGTEAVRRLTVKDFPATVVIDCKGTDLYRTAPQQYRTVQEEPVK